MVLREGGVGAVGPLAEVVSGGVVEDGVGGGGQ